jgi:hypothetical protein
MTNYDEELRKAIIGMEDTEDALTATGFSVEQWELIKRYVLLAIHRNELAIAKSLEEPETNPG